MRRFLLFLWVCAFDVSASWHTLVDSYLADTKATLKQRGIPGAGIAIVHAQYPDVVMGLGVTKRRGGEPVSADTPFRLASVSKTFAGALGAKLAASNQLPLDTKVAAHLASFQDAAYAKDLTAAHLLSHSAGIVPNAYDNLIESRTPYSDIISALTQITPLCSPGSCYGYQNALFSVFGDLVKAKTGLDYATWLEEFIFSPLNMKSASVGMPKKDSHFAMGHILGRKRWYSAPLKPNYYKVLPAAGVNASANDMAIWLKALMGHYPSVLNEDALALMTTPHINTKKELRRRVWRKHLADAHYGLGLRLYDYNDETIFYHSGWVQGYRTDLVVMPRLGVGFALMLNAESGVINELTTRFIQQVLAHDKQVFEAVAQVSQRKVSQRKVSQRTLSH